MKIMLTFKMLNKIKRFFFKNKKLLIKKIEESLQSRIHLFKIFILILCFFCIFSLCFRSLFTQSYSQKNVTLNQIYDTNNNLLAYNAMSYQINIDTSRIKNVNEIWNQISHLNIDKNQIQKKINQKEKFTLAKDLIYEDIKNIKYPGIEIYRFIKRKYPLGKKFTSIGFANLKYGIIQGVESLALKEDVYLTIDARVQNILAYHLEEYNKECRPKEGAFGIILNKKGEILALHTTNCPEVESKKGFFNNIFFGLFEFGSVFKIFTIFAGLFYKHFTVDSVLDTDQGQYLFDKHIMDYEYIPRFSNIWTIISKSSNRGTIVASRMIGAKLVDFFKLMKLNEQIDLGFLKTNKPKFFKKYKDDEVGALSFGYNNLTNIFNIMRGFMIIFSNGKIINPTLFKNDKRNRVIGNIPFDDYRSIIAVMQHTAARHPILQHLKCASKSGTVNRVIGATYDEKVVNVYFFCAVPGISKEFEYFILCGSLKPEDYNKAGWNLRRFIAKISEQICVL